MTLPPPRSPLPVLLVLAALAGCGDDFPRTPLLQLDPEVLRFGTGAQAPVVVGETAVRTLLVRNTGVEVLELRDVAVSGDAPPFLYTGDAASPDFDGPARASLATADFTSIRVRLRADAPGEYAGLLRFTTNDPARAVVEVPLEGRVAAP